MNIDYTNLERDVTDGSFRHQLEEELAMGFRQLHEAGEPLPPASYYASRIAEIVNHGVELSAELKYDLYQEILLACEKARAETEGRAERGSIS